MEQTNLEVESQAYLKERLQNSRVIVEKQVLSFGRLLLGKISENYKIIDKERFGEVLAKYFITPALAELDSLFKYYQKDELEFYYKNLKTADLVFNTLKDKRNQTIYLENIIKKIEEREEDIQSVFTVSARNRLDSEEQEKYPSLNMTFNKFIDQLITFSNLQTDESEKLYNLVAHYYNLFQKDLASSLEHYLNGNKEIVVSKIDDEMDKKQIRNGKLSSLYRMERQITNEHLHVMEKLLETTISKHKNNTRESLKDYSSSITGLIFKLLPEKYRGQKELIDIIIDTNINERLGKMLDIESEKLSANLSSKNRDSIENEFYEEKRYKKIDDYKCNLDLTSKVYHDVLHEICIAYDIPEDDQNAKRLKILLLSDEANYLKNVFNNFFTKVKQENKHNLNNVIIEMNKLRDKAYREKLGTNRETQIKHSDSQK